MSESRCFRTAGPEVAITPHGEAELARHLGFSLPTI